MRAAPPARRSRLFGARLSFLCDRLCDRFDSFEQVILSESMFESSSIYQYLYLSVSICIYQYLSHSIYPTIRPPALIWRARPKRHTCTLIGRIPAIIYDNLQPEHHTPHRPPAQALSGLKIYWTDWPGSATLVPSWCLDVGCHFAPASPTGCHCLKRGTDPYIHA
jgi:hypothetical protein